MLVKLKEDVPGFEGEGILVKGRLYPVYAITYTAGYETYHILCEYYMHFITPEYIKDKLDGCRYIKNYVGYLFEVVDHDIEGFDCELSYNGDLLHLEFVPSTFKDFQKISNQKNGLTSVLDHYYSGDEMMKTKSIQILQEWIDYVNSKYDLDKVKLVEPKDIFERPKLP